jgi:hypothetical protein
MQMANAGYPLGAPVGIVDTLFWQWTPTPKHSVPALISVLAIPRALRKFYAAIS